MPSKNERSMNIETGMMIKGNEELSKIALNFQSHSQSASPVDTGRFRASFILSYNRPDQSILFGTDANESIQRSIASIAAVRNDDSWHSIYVTNNTPYGPGLNEGRSKQAPPNFILSAVYRSINAS